MRSDRVESGDQPAVADFVQGDPYAPAGIGGRVIACCDALVDEHEGNRVLGRSCNGRGCRNLGRRRNALSLAPGITSSLTSVVNESRNFPVSRSRALVNSSSAVSAL